MPASRKIVVGLFVLGGFFLFALGLFWIGDRRLLFSESLELQTEFANLSGLKTGSKVLVGGMGAGEVLSIQVPAEPEGKFRVRFRVMSRFQPMLRADSVASIQVEGLVGSKVLQVDSGTRGGARIQAGSVLPSREPVEIAAVIQQSVEVIGKVSTAVDDVQGRVVNAIDIISNVGEEAGRVVKNVGEDVDEVFGTGQKIARDVDSIVDGIRQGRGLAGRLLTDDQLAASVSGMVKNAEAADSNVSRTSADVRRIVGDIESRNLGETFQRTARNVEQASAGVKDVLAELRPPGGEEQRGLLDDVRDTLSNARQATSSLAENMEALKRNWFFRGFFNRRGFYNLESVSLEDYLGGKVARGRPQQRSWLSAEALFRRDPSGREILTAAGGRAIDEAMAEFLSHAPNALIVVEGYPGAGAKVEQYLGSRTRARLVRDYLVDRFGLNPGFVGAMPMGDTPPPGAPAGFSDGVSLVFFAQK